MCVWFSSFSPPLHSGFCVHLFLAVTVQKIPAIAQCQVPCNRCAHPLCLTLGSVDHSAPKTVLLQFTCCNVLFPPVPLVTPLRDFSNYCSSIKQVSKNARFLIPSCCASLGLPVAHPHHHGFMNTSKALTCTWTFPS